MSDFTINLLAQIDGSAISKAGMTASGGISDAPAKIIDGSTTTYCRTRSGSPIILDLGALYNVTRITWTYLAYVNMDMYYSEDNITYVQCRRGSSSSKVTETFYTNPRLYARYLKFKESSAINSGFIYEVDVYHSEAALGITATCTGDAAASWGTDHWRKYEVADGSTATPGAGTAQLQNTEYLQYELPEIYTIATLDYYYNGYTVGNCSQTFHISENGADWTEVYSDTPTEDQWNTLNVFATAKYIKWTSTTAKMVPRELRIWTSDLLETATVAETSLIASLVTEDINQKINTCIQVKEDVNNFFNTVLGFWSSMRTKINTVALVLSNINQKINTVISVQSNLKNKISSVVAVIGDLLNDFRFYRQEKYDVTNDVRFIQEWMRPAGVTFKSLGKSYIKVYINAVEQTTVDVDSIIISRNLNQPATCSFILGVPYDTSKPAFKSPVTVVYNDLWTLYSGFISNISSYETNGEGIQIECKDQSWIDSLTNVYFSVGHNPGANNLLVGESYYDTIASGLSACGGPSVGSFVPSTINCFGMDKIEAMTTLITQAGNYAWYYDSGYQLWTAGGSGTINLEAQQIGTNLDIHQVLAHKEQSSVENVVNGFRVQMGDRIRAKNPSTGGSKEYTTFRSYFYSAWVNPKWDSVYEKIVSQREASITYGRNFPEPGLEHLYQDVYARYQLNGLSDEKEEWSDEEPPQVILYPPSGWDVLGNTEQIVGLPEGPGGYDNEGDRLILNSGYTIDYKRDELIFHKPIFIRTVVDSNPVETLSERAPILLLKLWKRQYYTRTVTPTDNPESDTSNPLMFFVGGGPVWEVKNLSQFSIQEGGSYPDGNGGTVTVPSWNDTSFATNYANWELSKVDATKTTSEISITIDALCFYDIKLKNSIMIDGVYDSALTITSMRYNFNDFTVSLSLESGKNYTRTVSIQKRGG